MFMIQFIKEKIVDYNRREQVDIRKSEHIEPYHLNVNEKKQNDQQKKQHQNKKDQHFILGVQKQAHKEVHIDTNDKIDIPAEHLQMSQEQHKKELNKNNPYSKYNK